MSFCRLSRSCLEGKTRSSGTFSPSVRVSFAMRRRRASGAEGESGVAGVVGIGVTGAAGRRGSEGGMGTACRRRTSGRGSSLHARGVLGDLAFCALGGSGRDAAHVGGKGAASEAQEELVDEVYSELEGVPGRDGSGEKRRACLRADLDDVVGPRGSAMGMGSGAGSRSWGVLPRTAPSLRAERMRR